MDCEISGDAEDGQWSAVCYLKVQGKFDDQWDKGSAKEEVGDADRQYSAFLE